MSSGFSHSRIKFHFIMVYSTFNILTNLVCSILLKIFASIFIGDYDLWFSWLSFDLIVLLTLYYELGNIVPSSVLWDSLKNDWCYFIKYFTEFTCEHIWSVALLCREAYDYWFNLFARYWSIIFYFFMSQFQWISFFEEFVHFIYIIQIVDGKLLPVFSCNSFHFLENQ